MSDQKITINKDVLFMQQFSAACVAQLKLLNSYCLRILNDAKKNKSEEHDIDRKKITFISACEKFNDAVVKYTFSLQNGTFDYQKILRKIYDILKTEQSANLIMSRDESLFDMRNDEGKIISILPGINFKLLYKYLSDDDNKLFWQYFHLMTLSTFNIYHFYNHKKVESQPHVVKMMKNIGSELVKTGVMINDQIFNPYLGLGDDEGNYDIEDLFSNTIELQSGDKMNLDSILSVLGIGNLINTQELNQKLGELKESELEIATDKIIELFGANSDDGAKNVCNKLVRNIVSELKTKGIENIGDVLKTVSEQSKSEFQTDDMKNTMNYVQGFMANGQDKIKNLKDENGNQIDNKLLSTLLGPLSAMCNKQPFNNNNQNQKQN